MSQVTVKGYVGGATARVGVKSVSLLKKITDMPQTPNTCFLKDLETDIAVHYYVQGWRGSSVTAVCGVTLGSLDRCGTLSLAAARRWACAAASG